MTKSDPARRIFCALDTSDASGAAALAHRLKGLVGGVKLGKEFFTANGPQGVAAVTEAGLRLFLDLKFHDIPHTVAGAVRAAARLNPFMVTVHAAGGPAMLRAAAEAAAETGAETATETGAASGAISDRARPLVIAVTVLTSLNDEDLAAIGVTATVTDEVRRLAALAQDSGLDGVVCSPWEVAMLRAQCGPAFRLVVPGIRPADSAAGDQKRVMGPAEALHLGADFLVIGRPITAAPDAAAAARHIAAEMAAG